MQTEDAPAVAGVVACLLVVGSVVLPYVALPSAEAAGLGTYYGFGVVGPWAAVVFALAGVVAFAAGIEDRTDPETVAGAMLVVGLGMTLVAVEWAFAVDTEVVLSITTAGWIELHRWVVVGLTATVPASAAGYAVTLDVV
jgi:hypothetical protein